MDVVEDAISELSRARDGEVPADVRTQLDSIAVSLQEMTDTEEGEWTNPEGSEADTLFEGAAPSADNLDELEETLSGLAAETDGEARRHILAAAGLIADYREQQRGEG